jgi:hypothetical protein
MDGFGGFAQGLTNAMNAITNQVIRASGKSVKNGGWPYFDGTFKEYPSFKRKFRTYQANYHQATPQRELAQMFRENCLPDKIALHVRKAEDMLMTWRIMDAVYDNLLAFIKDLMEEIRAVPEFRENESEKMMEYYMLLQSHIAEADKADVGAMLLIPANIADMFRILPYAEGKRWRDQLGRIHPLDIGNGFSNFVDRRLEYATTQVANCERLGTPEAYPPESSRQQVAINGSTRESGRPRRLGESRKLGKPGRARDGHKRGEEAGRRKEGALPASEEI